MKYEIHLGERLEFFVKKAKHGKGLTGFSDFIGRSKSVVYNMYKSADLDFKIVLKACDYYGVTVDEFVGCEVKGAESLTFEVNEPQPEYKSGKLEQMDRKLDEILKLIKK